jgi:hypothetical protein
MLVVHTTKGSPVIVLGRATWRLYSDSPRDGATTFSDLIGKLDVQHYGFRRLALGTFAGRSLRLALSGHVPRTDERPLLDNRGQRRILARDGLSAFTGYHYLFDGR